MNILALDTCFSACSVAVDVPPAGAARTPCSERAIMETGHAEALMPMIGRVVSEAGIAVADIDRIVVTRGPGTFTGVRTGIAAARGLALATGATLVGVSSLWSPGFLAPTLIPECIGDDDAVLVVMDARKGMVYAQVIDTDARELTDPLLVDVAGAAALLPRHRLFAVGTAARIVGEAAAGAGRTIAWKHLRMSPEDHLPNAVHLIGLGHLEACAGPLQPLYLRAPDAKPQSGKSLPWVAT
jgi:tRNA threonylcarbamoyl adenosine modification protein YeaZ